MRARLVRHVCPFCWTHNKPCAIVLRVVMVIGLYCNHCSAIIELRQHLEILERVHSSLMSEGLSLDPWACILSETVEAIQPGATLSRIVLHVIRGLLVDLFPTFIYNDTTQRFVVSPMTEASKDFEKLVRAFAGLRRGGLVAASFALR